MCTYWHLNTLTDTSRSLLIITDNYWHLLTHMCIYWHLNTLTDTSRNLRIITDTYLHLLTLTDTCWHLLTLADTYCHILTLTDTYSPIITLRTTFWVLILWTWANDHFLLLTSYYWKAKPISARILRALKMFELEQPNLSLSRRAKNEPAWAHPLGKWQAKQAGKLTYYYSTVLLSFTFLALDWALAIKLKTG